MLRKLTLKGVYKSDQDDILSEFYLPALSVASFYDRAVGFFSASTLSQAAQALSTFIAGGGKARLIVGAFSDQGDIDALSEGHSLKEISDRLGAQFLASLGEADDDLFRERFRALAWLVAHGRLDVRVALRPQGMFHDKVGIITDADGDAVVFAGSANESAAALLPTRNYESINVFPTWREELADYHQPHRASFQRLWENRSRDTAVIDLPTAVREKLLEVAKSQQAPPDPEREAGIWSKVREIADLNSRRPSGPALPETLGETPFEMKRHQLDALSAWRVKGDFTGILDLATGAGKTITAIYSVVQLAKRIPGLTVVIAAPYQSLADQWCEILEVFNIQPLKCYVSRANWQDKLEQKILNIQNGLSTFEAVVVVNRTLKTPEFQGAISRIPTKQFLWIGDECHHHGSASFSPALPQNARYRLGLSATPEHYLDHDRNDRLRAYYGDIVYRYSLEQAINDKVLTPYNYFPTVVALTEGEAADFIGLSEQISAMYAREVGKSSELSTALTALLMRRARLVGSAENKLPALVATLANHQPETHSLFYCGDGRMIDEDHDDDPDEGDDALPSRQIEVVSGKLDDLGWKVSRFTARESRGEREGILRNFRIGVIDGLVAIKCLDEGIDVPACRTAYILASSRDPRQFIQRRGRILRRSPGKTIANIFDYVVVLPEGYDVDGPAGKLVREELKRVAEFSNLAENRFAAYDALRSILVTYDLAHLL